MTGKTLDFCYNVVAQIESNNIEALVVAGVREGGWYEELAADPKLGAFPGGWSAVPIPALIRVGNPRDAVEPKD